MRLLIWLCLPGLVPAKTFACRVPEVFFFEFASVESAAGLYERLVSRLERAGWWNFVCSNTDRIEFYNAEFVEKSHGQRALGTASIERSRRVMAVATYNYRLEEIARVMVHEAGHLEHFREHGSFDGDQSWARRRELEFLRGSEPGRVRSLRWWLLNAPILLGALLGVALAVLYWLDPL